MFPFPEESFQIPFTTVFIGRRSEIGARFSPLRLMARLFLVSNPTTENSAPKLPGLLELAVEIPFLPTPTQRIIFDLGDVPLALCVVQSYK